MNGNDRSLVRAIRGPITLITVGVLFAFNNFTPYGFGQTWPVLLIVFGLLSLLRRGTEPVIPPEGGAGFPPYGFPPPSSPAAGYATPPGGYRQSSYPNTTPPAGPAKGGFGTSAPPRSTDPGQTPPPGDSI
jgi:hypothetical protein